MSILKIENSFYEFKTSGYSNSPHRRRRINRFIVFARWRQCVPHLTHDFVGPRTSASRTKSRSDESFLQGSPVCPTNKHYIDNTIKRSSIKYTTWPLPIPHQANYLTFPCFPGFSGHRASVKHKPGVVKVDVVDDSVGRRRAELERDGLRRSHVVVGIVARLVVQLVARSRETSDGRRSPSAPT